MAAVTAPPPGGRRGGGDPEEGEAQGVGRPPTRLRGGACGLDPAGVKTRGKDWARVSGGGKREKKTRPLCCCV